MIADPAVAPLVWTYLNVEEGRPCVVRLSTTTLTLVVASVGDLERAAEGPAQVIPLAAVTEAEGDDGEAECTLRYRVGRSKIEETSIVFADPRARRVSRRPARAPR